MNSKQYTDAVTRALSAHADTHRAREMKAYLRGQFEFLGIQAPARRLICKQLPKLPPDGALLLRVAKDLWQKPEREYRYVACDLLANNAKAFSTADLPAFKKLLQQDAWWETVDGLSGVIGDIVLNEGLKDESKSYRAQAIMDEWLTDTDFWVRRSAMIHQLGWRLQTDTDRLSRYALTLSTETEFFIRKAIGWALRDYAKWNPEFVRRLIQQKGSFFSSLTIREACKNLRLSQK
jgi:3-methyladenine DNA glycosylase AlkD